MPAISAVQTKPKVLTRKQAERWAEIKGDFLAEVECVTESCLGSVADLGALSADEAGRLWRDEGRVLALAEGGDTLYPAFQFADGAPIRGVGELIALFDGLLDSWQIAIWLNTPNAHVGNWDRPSDLILNDCPKVLAAAAARKAETSPVGD